MTAFLSFLTSPIKATKATKAGSMYKFSSARNSFKISLHDGLNYQEMKIAWVKNKKCPANVPYSTPNFDF